MKVQSKFNCTFIIYVYLFCSTSITTYSDLHPVLNFNAQSDIPDVTIKFVSVLFSLP